jgi:outer membrane protein assembly factor BamB
LSGNILFVSFRFRNQIRAIDTTTGNSAWSFSAPGQYEYFSSLIVSDNKLFASTRLGHLYCFEEEGIGDDDMGKYTVVNYTDTTILTSTDMEKIHVMDVATGDKYFTLPPTSTVGVGTWVTLVRKGGANKLAIIPDPSDVILNTAPTGQLVCDEIARNKASIELIVPEVGFWIPKTVGIWKSFGSV